MATPRKLKIDPSVPSYYQLSNRCVRQAFAIGKGERKKLYYKRKAFIENLLKTLCACFMMRLLEFTLMDNHYHMVVHFDPRRMDDLSDEQVVELVFKLDVKSPNRRFWTEKKKQKWKEDLLKNKKELAQWRVKLCDPSKFMSYFNYAVAVECNRQDGVKGHFWEDRFDSITLHDAKAVLNLAVYTAVNPVRGGMCAGLVDNPHGGLSIMLWSRAEEKVALEKVGPVALAQIKNMAGVIHPVEEWFEDNGWSQNPRITLEQYAQLCEAAARLKREGKRGYLKPEEEGTLKKLGIEPGELRHLDRLVKQFRYHAGSPESLRKAAEHFGRKRLWGTGRSVQDVLSPEEIRSN